MKKLNAICKKALTITDAELREIEELAHDQMAYLHPLKMAAAAKMHALGQHNMAVATKLRELRDTIAAGAKLAN